MQLARRRSNSYVFGFVTVFLVVILLCCYFQKSLRRKTFIKSITPDASTGKMQYNPENNYFQTNKTLLKETDVNNTYKKLSPYLNPVFNINISKDMSKLVILFLNAPIWFKQWSVSADMNECLKFTNCQQSFDRSNLNRSQAVVLSLAELTTDTYPPVKSRNPNQVWVFFTLESPLHLNPIYKNPQWRNVFNWSWTYHPNADIFHPYGVLVKKQTLPQRNYTDIFRKKTKFAAWAVSNCNAPSKRNDFVKILKKYVDVDIFGQCGQRAPNNLENVISEKYKFYLAFENSLCDEYMTEKVFHYYKLDAILVTRGKTEYHKYLPNGSFIDTAQFSSIAALAQFMKHLGEDEEKYVSYLKVKDEYTVYETEFLYKDALCNLCEKLNNLEQNRHTYGNTFKWLGRCHDAMDLRENSTENIYDFAD